MILPYVYKLIHRETGQFYFGYRSKNVYLGLRSIDDLGIKYFTSSKTIKKSFGEFEYSVLAELYTAEYAYDLEQELIREHWGNPLLLNRHYHAEGKDRWRNTGHSEETKKHLSKVRTGYKTNKPAWNAGKTKETDISLRKMSNSLLGNIPWNKNISKDDPRRQTGERNSFFGRKHSEETLIRIKEKAQNRVRKECEYCGKIITPSNYSRWHGKNCKEKL